MEEAQCASSMKLEVLRYERLLSHDESETQKLVSICSDTGIFFLDLGSSRQEVCSANKNSIIDAQRAFFAASAEVKEAYADDSPNRGYDGSQEFGVQRIKLSREQQIRGELNLPAHLRAVEKDIGDMFTFNDTILRSLSTLLCTSLDPPVSMADIRDPHSPGASNMCLGLANASAGTPILGSHLDEDYLTITYYDEPFLEVLDRTSQEWKLVDVFQNMAIVNVGDRLQEISENRLHAPYHRVVQSANEIDLVMYDLNEGTAQ